jgi:hypothetical protein
VEKRKKRKKEKDRKKTKTSSNTIQRIINCLAFNIFINMYKDLKNFYQDHDDMNNDVFFCKQTLSSKLH